MNRPTSHCLGSLGAWILLAVAICSPAAAYVEIPYTLGRIIQESTGIVSMRVEKVDKEKNLILFRKIADLKGKSTADVIKHNIGRGGFHPREWQNIMDWAEVGKTAIFFNNGGSSETCIHNYWYQAYPNGEWWGMSHAEPYLLRSYAGSPDKLIGIVNAMLAGQEVVVPCMVDGDKNALQMRSAKIQRMKASLKVIDYNAERDFVGWGGEDFRPLAGMPGFSHLAEVSRVDPEAQGVSLVDLDGDGQTDFCFFGNGKVGLFGVNGNSLNEASLPFSGGARSAEWADFNGNGKPDLLLAAPDGPKLLANLGTSFADVSGGLPHLPHHNVTAAAWLDYDGDRRPDILLANGFHGLRLYRNLGPAAEAKPLAPTIGKWHYIGPFDFAGGRGFDTAYPPEREINLKAVYDGKGGEKAAWREGAFQDGQVNNLALFKPEHNQDTVVYLYREFEFGGSAEMPISLGSDDTLTVWLNGEKIISENTQRACAPDQNKAVLKLRPGKNQLLLKICQGSGDFAFYYAAQVPPAAVPPLFEDVSEKVGLGPSGLFGQLKGDRLLVADFNKDGRPDFLYCAGNGVLALNTPQGFTEVKNSGLSFVCGKVAPVAADFNGDGHLDLFVPQAGGGKLYAGNGQGQFADVTAASGILAQPRGRAVAAAAIDFDGDGKVDLFLGCLQGANRYLRNVGNGKFVEAGVELGLHQKVFNTKGLAVADVNKDGVLDLLLNNEGQDSVVLLGKRPSPAETQVGSNP